MLKSTYTLVFPVGEDENTGDRCVRLFQLTCLNRRNAYTVVVMGIISARLVNYSHRENYL